MRDAVACAVLALVTAFTGPRDLAAGEDEAAGEIRGARDGFNRAIRAQRPEGIDGFLAPHYVLITGRGDRFDGREENLELWRETFRADPTFNCQRTPGDIDINRDWGLAQETGRWVCTQTVDGEPGRYTGVYAAKWQRAVDSTWLLQSEVFTTLTCEGPEAACRRPNPVAP